MAVSTLKLTQTSLDLYFDQEPHGSFGVYQQNHTAFVNFQQSHLPIAHLLFNSSA